jgi:hypothetical protein
MRTTRELSTTSASDAMARPIGHAVDDMLEAYVDSREDAAAVADAYARWTAAPGSRKSRGATPRIWLRLTRRNRRPRTTPSPWRTWSVWQLQTCPHLAPASGGWRRMAGSAFEEVPWPSIPSRLPPRR